MSVQTEEKKRPEISVIVPVYNVAPYLSACLDSVLAQTLRDFELILVDDGSTDGSREIAKEYEAKDERVRLFLHRWNHGVTAAHNLGLEVSRGKYVVFVDSDDIVVPDCLEILYRAIEILEADVVQAGFQEFAETPGDGDVYRLTKEPAILSDDIAERAGYFVPLRLHIAPWSKIFRRSFLDRHRMLYYDVPVADDVCFHYQCLLAAQRYAVLPEILYQYRKNRKGSVQSVQGFQRAERYAVSMARSLEEFSDWAQQEERFADARLQKALCRSLYLFFRENLRRIAAGCGNPEAVIAHCQAAIAGEPCHVLEAMMMYCELPPTASQGEE